MLQPQSTPTARNRWAGIVGAAGLVLLPVLSTSAVEVPASHPPDDSFLAQPAVSSFDVAAGSARVFRPQFDPIDGSGDLQALPISAQGVVDESRPLWSARKILGNTNFDATRKIFTRSTDATAIPFRWNQLAREQKLALGNLARGPALLDYVRGDRSNEAPQGAQFAPRDSVLGAIRHSTPRYYAANGQATVFVGASDGMLHAFDAETGVERFAYLPSMLIPRLAELGQNGAWPEYLVDGSPAIGRVPIGGEPRVLLVASLGAAGPGLFALDVSRPQPESEAAAVRMLLWEIDGSAREFADLGQVWSTPQIARTADGTAAVFIGNGYAARGSGQSALLVIDAASGRLLREIATGVGNPAHPNGLSGVRLVDADGDGLVDAAYAGDLAGVLWKFDLAARQSEQWSVAELFATAPAEPIVTRPAIERHPAGGRMVLFAGGAGASAADGMADRQRHVYGIWDGAPASNRTLLSQEYTSAAPDAGLSQRVRMAGDRKPNWAAGGDRGWKLPLPIGESVVGDGTYCDDGRYVFVSTLPPSAGSPGEIWLGELDYLSGGAVSRPVFDLNEDGQVDARDRLLDRQGRALPGADGLPVSRWLGTGLASQALLLRLAVFGNTLINLRPPAVGVLTLAPGASGSGGRLDLIAEHRVGTRSVNGGVQRRSPMGRVAWRDLPAGSALGK